MSNSSNSTTTNSCSIELEEETPSFLSVFQLTQILGEGAFARVFLGTHSLDGQKYAIKQALTSGCNEDLQNEARILGLLDHVFINKLYYFNDSKYTNQLSCMVLELEENGDLLDNVMRFGRFQEPVVRRIAIQMLDALEYMHRKGIAHNDIKCENFVFNQEFDIKLIDFGLATESRYISSQILGTIGYQSPEIVQKQLPYDAFKADIFALGVVFFTMYIGKFPFKEANPQLSNYKLFLLNNDKFWQKHEMSHRNLKISQEFKELINGMLNINAFERFDFQRIKQMKWINENLAIKGEVRQHCQVKERK